MRVDHQQRRRVALRVQGDNALPHRIDRRPLVRGRPGVGRLLRAQARLVEHRSAPDAVPLSALALAVDDFAGLPAGHDVLDDERMRQQRLRVEPEDRARRADLHHGLLRVADVGILAVVRAALDAPRPLGGRHVEPARKRREVVQRDALDLRLHQHAQHVVALPERREEALVAAQVLVGPLAPLGDPDALVGDLGEDLGEVVDAVEPRLAAPVGAVGAVEVVDHVRDVVEHRLHRDDEAPGPLVEARERELAAALHPLQPRRAGADRGDVGIVRTVLGERHADLRLGEDPLDFGDDRHPARRVALGVAAPVGLVAELEAAHHVLVAVLHDPAHVVEDRPLDGLEVGRLPRAGRVLEDPVVLEREEDLHAVLLPEVEAPLRIRIAGLGLVEPPLPGHHRVPLLEDVRAGLLEELPRRVRVRGVVEPGAVAVALRQAAGVAEVGRGGRLALVLDRLGGEVDEEGVAHVVLARGGVGGSGGRGQRGEQGEKADAFHGLDGLDGLDGRDGLDGPEDPDGLDGLDGRRDGRCARVE